MIDNDTDLEAAYSSLRYWQHAAADGKLNDAGREEARSKALECARAIAQYESREFWHEEGEFNGINGLPVHRRLSVRPQRRMGW